MHLKIAKNDQKWLNYRFFWFLSQIKSFFFYLNRFFMEYFLSSLLACHWLIMSDYSSSIFPMLNSHKKNGFFSKKVSPSRFWLNTSVFVYVITYQMRTTLSRRCALKENFLTFSTGDKCYIFLDFLIYLNEFLLKTFALQQTFVNFENNNVMDLEKNRKS